MPSLFSLRILNLSHTSGNLLYILRKTNSAAILLAYFLLIAPGQFPVILNALLLTLTVTETREL